MSDTFYVVWLHRDGRVTAVLAMADRESCERYAAYKNRRQHAAWFEVRAER